jgi:hypothetical protein
VRSGALTLADVQIINASGGPCGGAECGLFHVKQSAGWNSDSVHTRPCFLNPPKLVNFPRISAEFEQGWLSDSTLAM